MKFTPGQLVEYGRDSWFKWRRCTINRISDTRNDSWFIEFEDGNQYSVHESWLRPLSPLVALAEAAE